MIYCANCGTGLQNDALFCPECGTKTEKAITAASTPIIESIPIPDTPAQPTPVIIPTTPAVEVKPAVELAPPPPTKQYCRNCGKEVAAGAFACMGCGLPPMKANNYCNSCGAPSHTDAVVCIKCGIKLTNRSASSATIIESKKIYCRNCGKEVLPGAVACVSCGLPPSKGKVFCNSCGSPTNPDAIVCIKCGVKLGTTSSLASISMNTGTAQSNPSIMTGAFWGSILVIVGFFMPWVKVFGSFNGANIAKFIADSGGDDSAYSILLYLLPVSAVIFLFSAFSGNVSPFAKGVRYIPLILVIIAVISIASKTEDRNSDFSMSMGDDFLNIIGIGLIITIIGSIMMCFYNPKKE